MLLLDKISLSNRPHFVGFVTGQRKSWLFPLSLAISNIAVDTSEQAFCAAMASFSLVYKTRMELRGEHSEGRPELFSMVLCGRSLLHCIV